MSKRSAPFTLVVMGSLLLATMAIVVNTGSNQSPQSPNELIGAKVADKVPNVNTELQTCSPTTGDFVLSDDLEIAGEGVSPNKNEAIDLAKKNLKSKQQEVDALASPHLPCQSHCKDDEITCNWSRIICSAEETEQGNWQAICDGTVNCNKICVE